MQVSGGVRYTPRSSRPKSSGLSTTAQLPLETRAGSEKQGLPGSRTFPAQCVGGVLSEGCLSRGGVTQLLELNSLCKFKEMAYEFKELT